MGDISISNGVRSNLTALQSTARMMEQTQDRLSTGKRVNSAMDNPANFFTASAMNNRAGDLGSLLDSMKTGVNTIKAADKALTAITKLVESAQGSARQALQDAGTHIGASITGDTAIAANKAAAEGTLLVGGLGMTAGDLVIATDGGPDGAADTSTLTFDATTTVKDVVDDINANVDGVVASISDDGKLSLEASDGGTINLTTATDAGDVNSLFGGDVTVNGTAAQSLTSGTATAAESTTDNSVRTKLAAQFNDVIGQITDLAEDADFNGINLLQGDNLKVTFNEKTGANENSITIKGVDMDAGGLGLSKVSNDFQSDTEINASLDSIKEAMTSLRSQASEFGSNLATVEVRQDFTDSMVNVLEQGASDLTLADTNREGANMLALQTSQQLATTTMGMASRADQAVLSFLR